jgi:hypothetical protein
LGGHHRGQGLAARRIEQQGVVAHDAAVGPVGLDHDTHVGFVDRPVADDAQVGLAVGAALQRDMGAGERGAVVDPGGAKRLRRAHAGLQGGRFLG